MSLFDELNALEKRVREITKDYRINISDLDEYRSSQDRIKELRSMLNSMR
jgi:septation ring formation regulator EzrA